MSRIRSFFPVLVLSLSFAAAKEKISYAREILPILSDNCFYCHGPDKQHQKADLRLDIRAEAIDHAHPEKSEILFRIFSNDGEESMPPHPANTIPPTPSSKAQASTAARSIPSGAAPPRRLT